MFPSNLSWVINLFKVIVLIKKNWQKTKFYNYVPNKLEQLASKSAPWIEALFIARILFNDMLYSCQLQPLFLRRDATGKLTFRFITLQDDNIVITNNIDNILAIKVGNWCWLRICIHINLMPE